MALSKIELAIKLYKEGTINKEEAAVVAGIGIDDFSYFLEEEALNRDFSSEILTEQFKNNALQNINITEDNSQGGNSDMVKTGEKICVVGMGYVGLPLACCFSKKHNVIGFDINADKIDRLKYGIDESGEVDSTQNCNIDYTTDSSRIKEADIVIIAVPTPVSGNKRIDLAPVKEATRIVGQNLKAGAIVVYESTVYPGCTERVCIPILEKESALKFGADFYVGYSPERVVPGDKERTIDKIVKVVSGSNQETLDRLAELYGSIIPAGIYRASSIKVAEAIKVVENIQRDSNIAIMNEFALMFDKLGINTKDVLDGAGTKWNFHKYHPGLVGGHCISVDPYYLAQEAAINGHPPHFILMARQVNDYMVNFIVMNVLKLLSHAGKVAKRSKVLIMGVAFKENVNDTRNSKIKDVIEELKKYGIQLLASDPLVKDEVIREEFGVEPIGFKDAKDIDIILVYSPHKEFKEFSLNDVKSRMSSDPVIYDLKNFYNKKEAEDLGIFYKAL